MQQLRKAILLAIGTVLPVILMIRLCAVRNAPLLPAESPLIRWQITLACDAVYALSFEQAVNGILEGGVIVSVDPEMSRPFPAGDVISGDLPDRYLPQARQPVEAGVIVTVITSGGKEHAIPLLYTWNAAPGTIARFTLSGSAADGFALTPADDAISAVPLDALPAALW